MKFLLLIAALVAVAVAAPNRMFDPTQVNPNPSPIIIGGIPEPINIGPAIVEGSPIVPSPIIVGPSLVEDAPIIPSPVAIQPIPETPAEGISSNPLVQIILNVQQ